MKKIKLWIINASPRHEGDCPQEESKSHRLAEFMIKEASKIRGVEAHLTNLYDYEIGPCKGCVSTAHSLCHMPCDCYPDARYPNDPMLEFYKIGEESDAIIFVTPVHWWNMSARLSAFMGRLTCVDGGNTKPQGRGKDPVAERKYVESGKFKPVKHWAGKVAGIMTIGDSNTGAAEPLFQQLNYMGFWIPPYCIIENIIDGAEYHKQHKVLTDDKCSWAWAESLVTNVVDTVKIIRGKKIKPPRAECLK